MISPLPNFPFKEPYLSSATSEYTVWFPYVTRDQILLLDRETNKVIKTLKFNKKNFAPSDNEIESEEGLPNFQIHADGTGSYYIVLMKNKVLEIYRAG